jgi:SAM-dependent methyltransferase
LPWRVGALPFVYTALNIPTNGDDLPDSLPFVLDVDHKSGTFVQAPSECVSSALSKAYLKGSTITGVMDSEGIGRQYAEDFLAFLRASLRRDRFDGMKVLEVGCGTGYLLHRLSLLGAEVLGVEPGAHGQQGSRRFGIPIIRDFFPSPMIQGRFDFIISYAVLEHIQSAPDYLSNLLMHLRDNGHVIIAVPDCEPCIRTGDISMLLHEHWNYYTPETLRNSIQAYTGLGVNVRKAGFGGSLYAIAEGKTGPSVVNTAAINRAIQALLNYRRLARRGITRFLEYLQEAARKSESVGIYVPGRAINALFLVRDKMDLPRIRFFDDNQALGGTYFPGCATPIESHEELVKSSTDRVLIASSTFGSAIAQRLRSTLSRRVKIAVWNDLFAD